MKNTKKIFAGIMALALTAGFTACSGGDDDSAEGTTANGATETTTEATTTTTAVTVEKNTETLKEEEQSELEGVMSQLKDVELENNTVKWMAHYDINPSGNGASKKVELEMFEQKYGGKIEWHQVDYQTRYDSLSTAILGGDGIDLFASDVYNLPKGIVSGMFQPIDDYIDINDAIWQNTAAAMDTYKFGDKHYMFVTNVRSTYWLYYNTDTLEANGLEDPWELYKAGEWNWDKFKEMLTEFVDEDNEQYGLDCWYNPKSIIYSTGIPVVGMDESGNLVCNMNDPLMEKAQNFLYDINQSGLSYFGEKNAWTIQPTHMGEGKQLFWIDGYWFCEGDPAQWMSQIPADKLGIAPVPNPEGSDPYQAATTEGYVLCKGAGNPQGAALFAECTALAVHDQATVDIQRRKTMDDNHWSQDILDRTIEIDSLANKYPVIDFATGVSKDVADYTWDGDAACMGKSFQGTDWATTREEYSDTLNMLVGEVNDQLQAIISGS